MILKKKIFKKEIILDAMVNVGQMSGGGGVGLHKAGGNRGGRGGGQAGRQGSRAGSPGTSADARVSGCFHCGDEGHFARECPKHAAAGISRSQFAQLQGLGNAKQLAKMALDAHKRAVTLNASRAILANCLASCRGPGVCVE